ncbi:MAG: hypothetical protein K8U57_35995 [Planctomycetes bacterium]|nr:hypothetical protein [Planctomycetota bacterium]
MPVNRCDTCKRGDAGYLDSEKSVHDLDLAEVETEKAKYQAKIARIKAHLAALKAGANHDTSPASKACPDCGHGWREFQKHRKDLEQLDEAEAGATLAATTRDYNALLARETALRAAAGTATGAGTP